jgi:hypothetical protein
MSFVVGSSQQWLTEALCASAHACGTNGGTATQAPQCSDLFASSSIRMTHTRAST